MNPNTTSKPSPIVMLAPLAFVLIGYHYFFHGKIQKEITARRVQQEKNADQLEQLPAKTNMTLAR